MKLILLGTSGYHPCPTRHTACMFLPEPGVLLDAGTGMYRLPRYLRTSELDIFLTHAHLDHIIGLTYLFSVAWLHPLDAVRVHGRAETLDAIDEHLFAAPLFPKRPPMELVPLEASEPLPGGGRLTHFPLEHQGGSIGYRLDWPGHSMAYVTDTTADPASDYIERIRGVDLLLHECYFPDAEADRARATGHSTTTPVAEVARQAGVKRLVLVHISPLAEGDDPIGLETARAIFAETALGEDRMELDF
ncbi:MAG: MBL fold metallo-hydrolase [Rhodopirellula sp.]|nr:MBL fold metallo-hydrolase [Rhodopirellula sp.]